jgi:hypothetical protein
MLIVHTRYVSGAWKRARAPMQGGNRLTRHRGFLPEKSHVGIGRGGGKPDDYQASTGRQSSRSNRLVNKFRRSLARPFWSSPAIAPASPKGPPSKQDKKFVRRKSLLRDAATTRCRAGFGLCCGGIGRLGFRTVRVTTGTRKLVATPRAAYRHSCACTALFLLFFRHTGSNSDFK